MKHSRNRFLSRSASRKHAPVLAIGLVNFTAVFAADLNSQVDFSIPPQTLAAALMTFAEQANIQVMTASADLRDVVSQGVSGQKTAREALAEILRGTGLRVREVSVGSVAIEPATASRDSNAHRSLRTSGIAYTVDAPQTQSQDAATATANIQREEPIESITVYGRGAEVTIRDVPQSTTVFGQELLQQTAAFEIRDVVRLIPSSATSTGHGAVVPQRINSRGFDTTYAVNGNAATSLLTMDTAGLERVEVLMGPASVLYGSMEPGAVVNMVTKKPLAQSHFGGGLEFGSYDRKRVTADVGGPLSDKVRVRFNGAYETRESYFDRWQRDRTYIAPIVEVSLAEQTLLTLEAWYARFEDQNGAYDRRLPMQGMMLPNPNGRIAERYTAVEPGLADYYRQAYNYRMNLRHQLGENWSLTGTAIYDLSSRKGIIWDSRIINSDLRTVRRSISRQDEEQPSLFGSFNLRGRARTGPVTHNLIMGVDYLDREFKGLSSPSTRVTDLDLFAPVYGGAVLPALSVRNKIEESSAGVFVQDRAEITQNLDILVGVRWSEIETKSARAAATATLPPLAGFKQDKFSTQYGVLYDVGDDVTLYASRVTSFVPRGGTTAGGSAFAPETGVQYEIGAKFALGDSGLNGNVAIYRIEKPNVLTPDLANPGFLMPIGEAQSRGVELSLSGAPVAGLFVQAGYGYMETEAEGGFELRHAPHNTLSAFARYDLQSGPLLGLGFSAALQYRDKIYPGPTEGLQLPDYTRLDLGLQYAFNDRMDFSLNVKNVTDEKVWDSDGPDWVALGEGRTFVAGVTFRL